MSKLYVALLILASILATECGPIIFTLCVTACNAGVVTCYAGVGFVFGTVTAGAGMSFSYLFRSQYFTYSKAIYIPQKHSSLLVTSHKQRMSKLYVALLILASILATECVPITFILCVASCNAGVVACYAGLGFVFGTVTAGAGMSFSYLFRSQYFTYSKAIYIPQKCFIPVVYSHMFYVGTPAAVLACNAAQSACMIACGAVGVAPVP
uniref:Transmembrane 9 superfamily member n=1 Tax=Ascaris lumbricoides TaxID=6252 RepID=A0A0M3IDX5_ASCLU